MPLRPVSELGLVELTDLASRTDRETADRRAPRGAGRTRPRPAPRDPNKDPRETQTGGRAEQDRAAAPRGRRTGSKATKDSSGASGRRRVERPRSAPSTSSAASRPKGLGGKSRGVVPSRAGVAPRTRPSSTTGMRRVSKTDRRRTRPRDDTAGSRTTKLSISVLTGAIGIAGGILIGRSAPQR
jgi:hypothetical protein